ncbi:bifunctional diaminohydroxyphosphoribosylaminopyrimidine deaminase/5-amino-6-(5-phosphoribosylamino)uracil reductase RibD [Halobacteriovorax sp. HLS]|uniref:bifunctional diaminohydroxyphosphoribosylaminopyrimidine deaminase/5-amino-6-(5-phosphoribosylamino)uracil reductase RibD n=1 Tax=Halobacteriovorax sp. HLS TaxID=2234000 RepID=UPI000FDB3F09|nr:bifunctional diaminohydroxyphosphoribosylaminopyrimidine deaminase/5-amino-6-(5-phosphoribosylamino)uracil reductase RibD [Halobacteriovorax sp. HLS]
MLYIAPMDTNTHKQYIRRCFSLAKKGLGSVSPNPLVGSVIVKDNIILGEGFHEVYGGPHAEPNAISNSKESLEGATLYCNLEPCCHTNKQTPPCVNVIIKNKIKRVIISNLDPNPLVAGNGVKILRDAGIEVLTGILEEEGRELNEAFFKFIQTGKPFVHIKLAQTLDGKIATDSGDSKWISNDLARKVVHEWRLKYDAVLVGRNTLSKDNPVLNIRMGVDAKGKVPYRIVMGSIENMDLSFNLFSDEWSHRTIIVTSVESYNNASDSQIEQVLQKKLKVIFIEKNNGSIDLNQLLEKLAGLKITSILVEGGKGVITSFIDQKQYDKISFFVCPKIIGNGISYYENDDLTEMKDAISFEKTYVESIDNQVLIHAYNSSEKSCLQD